MGESSSHAKLEAKGGNGNNTPSRPPKRKKRRTPSSAPRSPMSTPPDARKLHSQLEKGKTKSPSEGPITEEDQPSSEHQEEFVKFEMEEMKGSLETMNENIQRIEDERKTLRQKFENMTFEDQELFMRFVYDEFSENYDEHMRDTGHYGAIERLIDKELAAHHFLFPIMDLSVGTGVPFAHFLKVLNEQYIRECKRPKFIVSLDDLRSYGVKPIYANDLSERMTEKARKTIAQLEAELGGIPLDVPSDCNKKYGRPPIITSDDNEWIAFRNYSFRDLKHRALKKRVGTIFLSQTLHIVTDADKDRLAKAINWALAPGGRVILLEEFAWRARTNTSQTPSAVLKLVETIATPLQKKSELISLFKDSDKKPYEMVSRSIERIDYENRDHEMTMTILQKPGNNGDEQMKFFL